MHLTKPCHIATTGHCETMHTYPLESSAQFSTSSHAFTLIWRFKTDERSVEGLFLYPTATLIGQCIVDSRLYFKTGKVELFNRLNRTNRHQLLIQHCFCTQVRLPLNGVKYAILRKVPVSSSVPGQC